MPTVSIIMPVFNANPYLQEAVNSILSQDFTDFELIVIDDCSSDGSLEVLKGFKDPRISILKNDSNLGIVQTLNKGLKVAKGKYIARMDSDDVSMPSRIGKQFLFLESHPEIGIVGSWGKYIDEDGNVLQLVSHPSTDLDIKTLLLAKNCIFHPSVMLRRSLIVDRKYSEGYKHAEDYWLWAELTNCTKFHNIPDYLLKYRIRGNNLSILANRTKNERYKILGRVYKRLFEDIGIELSYEEIERYTSFVTMLERQPNSHTEMINIFKKILNELPVYYNDKLLQQQYSLVWIWHTRFKIWNSKTLIYNITGFKKYCSNKVMEIGAKMKIYN